MQLNPCWSAATAADGVWQEVGEEDDLDTEQLNNDDACTDNFEVDTDNNNTATQQL